jgi:DNA-binding LacI/PurR family transcriptional regulator
MIKMGEKKTIQQQILETLRQRLAGLPEGSRFQTEHELCAEFKVTRTTMTRVMVKLVEEGLLNRFPSRGSFVLKPQKPCIPISFLLPCPDFISETFSDISAKNSRRLLKGVSQIAFEYNHRVETVPVSPTNNQHDIDWRKLDFVNSDSMLVVDGDWYRDLFPLLLERNCRVAFVGSHFSHRQEDEKFINNCFLLTINSFGAAETAVEHLFRQGCRRIALFHHYISEPEHPTMGGYLSGLRKCGLDFASWHQLPEERLKLQGVKRQLKEFYKNSGGFDGLLIDPDTILDLHLHNLYQELGLDENIKIIVSCDVGNHQGVTGMAFPYEAIGQIAARHLLSPQFSPEKQLINGKLIERKSTSASSQKEKLIST